MICKYFLILCVCCFTLLIVSFNAQKVFLLMKSNLSIFSLVACAFDVISKKITAKSNVMKLPPLFSSKSFIVVVALMFKGPTSFFCNVDIQRFSAQFLKRLSFSPTEWCWPSCQKSFTTYVRAYFCALYSISLYVCLHQYHIVLVTVKL